jgi:nucleoside recognition membrane protein YjiH
MLAALRDVMHITEKKKERKIQSSKTRFRKENSYAMEQGIFQIIVDLYLV